MGLWAPDARACDDCRDTDHITGTGEMKKLVAGMQSVISKASGAKADVVLSDGDVVKFGSHKLTGLGTPGHTVGTCECCARGAWRDVATTPS